MPAKKAKTSGAAKAEICTKPTETAVVDAYMKALKHPLSKLAAAIRATILKADPSVGEEIKWNAPAFFYTGPMKQSDPKEYRRYLVIFNFYRKDCLRLVFWQGDKAGDTTGLLEGNHPDGRRLAHFANETGLVKNKKALLKAVKTQINFIKAQESVQ